MTLAEVKLWGRTIGAVSLEVGGRFAAFQFDPAFAGSSIEVSPITMPLSDRVYVFPSLPEKTFHGLPGLLADSLPDRFGNALIDAWLATQGRTPEGFNAVERLCYTGARGMGALEFVPALGPKPQPAKKIQIDALVKLASEILSQRKNLKTSFASDRRKNALNDILRVGTSAGGARAKAVIAWNSETNEVRSGQVVAGKGFGYWLLKFDGVTGNKDKELEDPKGYGAIEYAYSLMAKAAGAHFDFNHAGAYSYEQALLTIRQLNLPMEAVEEQFRRMTFNIIARNEDDHVKNIAFLMDKAGRWSLAPAFDMTYSYNPTGSWTAAHQMTMNGKRDGFTLADFRTCAKSALMKRGRAEAVIEEVRAAVARWPDYAEQGQVANEWRKQIQRNHRLELQRT
jgi:serine/threonine-protein kinase HipA